MKETFPKILKYIWAHEGGYVDHPRDPGGATNLGITHITLSKWRGKKVSKRDVRNLKKDEASKIYKKWYWNRVKADLLPAGVDYSVFDFGVNAGPRRSIKTLQKTVGATPDGVIGPITLKQVQKMNPSTCIKGFAQRRIGFYKRLRTFKTFGRGWVRRVKEVMAISLKLV